MNKVVALLLAGLALGGGSACTRRATPQTSPAAGASTPAMPAGVKASFTSFRYLTAKGKMQAELKGDKTSANVNLRVRRDSAVWLSASLLGIEGVRVLLTPDSVHVLNRLEKTYFVGSYAYLSRLLNVPVTFRQAQSLLLGDYLPAPSGVTPTVAPAAENGRQRVSYPAPGEAGLTIEQMLSVASGRLQQLKVSDAASANRSLTVDYSDFRPLEGSDLPFAYNTFVQARQAGGAVSTAAINYNKVDADRERLHFPFNVPRGYRRVR